MVRQLYKRAKLVKFVNSRPKENQEIEIKKKL